MFCGVNSDPASPDAQFLVETESGAMYLIDTGEQTIQRTSGDAPGMRRDDDAVRYLELLGPEVGRSMRLIIDLEVPGAAATIRETAPVVRVVDLTS